MNTFDTNEWMRLKTCEQSRLYYHTHKNYRKNKNKNDNECNKNDIVKILSTENIRMKNHTYIVLKKN